MNEIPRVDPYEVIKKSGHTHLVGTAKNAKMVKSIAEKLMEEYGFDYANERQAIRGVLGCSARVAGRALFSGVISQEQYNKLYRKAYHIA